MKRIRTIVGAAMIAAASTGALGQYPKKPVNLVVPFAAGGPTDAIARTVGRALQDPLGQPVIVENKPGAEGQIAVQLVHNAAPDGYTLYVGPIPAALVATKKDLSFNPMNLTPIAILARPTFGLYVSRDVPARNVEELVRYAKANPDKLNYASSTQTEDIATAFLLKATGIRMVRVPYKGSAQAIPELLAGRVQVYFAPLSTDRLAYAKDGRLRILATVSERRTPFTPDIPTLAESGIATPMPTMWNVLMGPPNLPRDIVQKLAAEVSKVVDKPETRAFLEQLVLTVGRSSPDELRASIQSDLQLWLRFAKEYDLAN